MKRIAIIAVLFCLFSPKNIFGLTVGTWNFSGGYGVYAPDSTFTFSDTLHIGYLGFGVDDFNSTNIGTGKLLEDIALTSSSTGSFFVANQTSDPDFNEAISVLTNNTYDYVTFQLRSGAGTVTSEANAFYGDHTGDSGIDFYGYSINSIGLQINTLSINIGHNGHSINVWYDMTAVIDGDSIPIPEPTTLLLLLSGLITLGAYKWTH